MTLGLNHEIVKRSTTRSPTLDPVRWIIDGPDIDTILAAASRALGHLVELRHGFGKAVIGFGVA